MVIVTLKLQRYSVIYTWASLKMQQIIKQTSPSMQLYEAVNLTFMNFFDFSVRIATFGAFLLFSKRFVSYISAQIKCLVQIIMHDVNLEKKEKCLKNGYFHQKIKNFRISKVDGLLLLYRHCDIKKLTGVLGVGGMGWGGVRVLCGILKCPQFTS